jgi:hypothetical protein
MKKTTFKTGATLESFINNVFETSMKQVLHQKALEEKEKQGGDLGALNATSDDGGEQPSADTQSDQDDNVEAPEPSKTGSDDDATMKAGDVTTKDITEKLNSIRSGKSFKDSAVSSAMDQYIQSLSKAERTALFAFLKGLAQIVTGEIDAQQATEPDSHPADVEMQKKDHNQHKEIKPNVIKNTKPVSSGGSEENTQAPVQVKKR